MTQKRRSGGLYDKNTAGRVMIKNKSGFIPKRYEQPIEYRKVGSEWQAVYYFGDVYYFVCLNVGSNPDVASSVSIWRSDSLDGPKTHAVTHSGLHAACRALEFYRVMGWR